MADFNRQAFEATVRSRSPLSPEQFDQMFGGSVTEENKSEAWKLMNLSPKSQFIVWNVAKHFEDVEITRVR